METVYLVCNAKLTAQSVHHTMSGAEDAIKKGLPARGEHHTWDRRDADVRSISLDDKVVAVILRHAVGR